MVRLSPADHGPLGAANAPEMTAAKWRTMTTLNAARQRPDKSLLSTKTETTSVRSTVGEFFYSGTGIGQGRRLSPARYPIGLLTERARSPTAAILQGRRR